jgi:pectinesterase
MVGSTSRGKAWAWLSGWGPIAAGTGGHGDLGTAVLVAAPALIELKELDDHYVSISRLSPGQVLLSFVGAGWSASRDFAGAEDWWRYLDNFVLRLEQPLRVELLGSASGAAAGQ